MSDTLTLLKRFLRYSKWSQTSEFENVVTWTAPEADENNEPIRIWLPSSSEYVDSQELCSKAINLLSHIYNQSKQVLLQTIEGLGYDSFRQRVNLDTHSDSIPLETISTLINNWEKLICYAACLEDDVQPFFAKSKKVGKQTLSKCRFGQTFQGSFGIVLQMPIIPPVSSQSESKIPFERRVMQRIGQGFYDIIKSVRDADPSLLVNNFNQGFNANMYEALYELLRVCPNGKSDFSFTWSPEYLVPEVLSRQSTIRLISADVTPLIETAAKELRKCSESEDTLIKGQIMQLHSDTDVIGDEDESSFNDEENGRLMVINWESTPGRKTKIRVALSETDHKQACDAYKNDQPISVRGRPEKRGKLLHLSAPRDFRVLESESAR